MSGNVLVPNRHIGIGVVSMLVVALQGALRAGWAIVALRRIAIVDRQHIAALRVDDAHFSIAGSGGLVARGSARRSRVSIAGSGNLRAREVTSDDASISVAGSGDVALTVRDDARVSIVGSGDVEISGPARCAVSRLGGGRVRCNGETVSS